MLKSLRSAELAHDIASAVFRVAALLRHEKIRKELEDTAIELVKGIDPKTIDSLGRLVRLAGAVGEMNEINAAVLHRELVNLQRLLNAEISASISGVSGGADLQRFFAEKAMETGQDEDKEIRNQEKRQEAILGYIRKFPHGCRLRQLSAEFSYFSERTVRTDVGRLIAKGLVEKLGSKTGPFSYFRAMNSPDFQPESAVTKGELISL